MVIPLRDDNPTSRLPVVTLLVIVANLVIFAVVQPHGSASHEAAWNVEHAVIPCEIKEGRPVTYAEYQAGICGVRAVRDLGASPDALDEPFPQKNVWAAVLASMFLHGSWLHVLGNMLFLWVFGNNVEDRLGKIGFAIFFVSAGLLSFGAHWLADPASTVPLVGASGAIAGVMGAYLVFWPRARVLTYVPLLLFVVVSLPAYLVLAIWFGLQFLTSPTSQVAWVAHVGGFVSGALIALALRSHLGPPRLGPNTRRARPPSTPWGPRPPTPPPWPPQARE